MAERRTTMNIAAAVLVLGVMTLSLLIIGETCEGDGDTTMPKGPPELIVEREARLATLLAMAGDARPGTSGIALGPEARLAVAFDNSAALARVDGPGLEAGRLLGTWREEAANYEGLSWDVEEGIVYAVVEMAAQGTGAWAPEIHRLDAATGARKERWPAGEPRDVEPKTGFEGLAHLRHGGALYLLALCEANGCGLAKGAELGTGGLIQVLRRDEEAERWVWAGEVELPAAARFNDYSGLDLRGDRLAVVSQEEAGLWVGKLVVKPGDEPGQTPRLEISGPGRRYRMPADDGAPRYCNIEGVSWLGDDTLALVSDGAEEGQAPGCRGGERSVHVVRLPMVGEDGEGIPEASM